VNVKDIAARAAKTFVQTFVATFVVAQSDVLNVNVLKVTAASALAAGLSAAWNTVQERVKAA
jgi:hypothetical protein